MGKLVKRMGTVCDLGYGTERAPPTSKRHGEFKEGIVWGKLVRVHFVYEADGNGPVELRWTERNESHIARHGVTPLEVEEAVSGGRVIVTTGRNDTKIVLGCSYSGRYLLTVLSEAEDGREFVVTARDMTLKEIRRFRKRWL